MKILFAQRISGRLKEVPAKRVRETKPEWMVREAVLGMLPKNKLRARRAKKLRVYGMQRVGAARGAEAAGSFSVSEFQIFSARCGSPLCLTVQRSPIAGSKPSVESLRRNVEFYGYAHAGTQTWFLGTGRAQGVGGARVPASGLRQVQVKPPARSSSIFPNHAWKHDAIEPLKFTNIADQVDVVVTAAWRRRGGQAER